MAFTIAQLQAKRDALVTVLGRGEVSVTFADRTTTYRSIGELERAIGNIDKEISKLAGRSRQSLGVASKGFA